MNNPYLKMAGFTLIPVVLAMSFIAAIAFLLNRDNGMNINMVANQMNADRARYAAEAGLQAVNAKVQSVNCTGYPVAASPIANNNFGGASYSAYATSASGNTTGLVSEGTYNGTSVTLTRSNIYVYKATPNTYTLQPNASAGMDTYITKPSTQNRGTSNTLNVDANDNFSLIKFDLSMFPVGSLPVSTTLSLFGSGGLGIGSINLYRLTNDWQEDTVNWPTRVGATTWNTPGGDFFSDKVTSAGAVTGAWVNFDITDLASSWLTNRHPNYGVIMNMAAGLGSINFASSDNSDATRRPKLTFNYLVPCGTTGPKDLPPTTTVTFNPVADSFNDSGAGSDNNGAATTIKVYYTPTRENRILMQFDTSSIPTGATIQSANLKTYVSAVGSATANTKPIWANAVNDAWVEGAGNNTNKNCPTVTAGTSWSYKTGCSVWTSDIHPPFTPAAWSSETAMKTKRTAHMVASVKNKIYVIGGQTATTGAASNVVEEYDTMTKVWTTKSSVNFTARSHAAVAVVNDKIYVLGGTTNGTTAVTKNEVYDPSTDTWTAKKVMPIAKMYMAAAVANGIIYTAGGATSTTATVNTLHAYDPASDTWLTKAPATNTTLTNMAAKRAWPTMHGVNNKIYVFGGVSNISSYTSLSSTEYYDPSNNTWDSKLSLPTSADSMSSAMLGSKIYLMSGYQNGVLSNVARVYDTISNSYKTLLNYPVASNQPAATSVNGKIYSLGGDDGNTTVFSNHYIYDPGIPVPVATAAEDTGTSPLSAGFSSGWINFDLKPLVQEWVDGVRPNNGLVLYTEVADQFSINSRENSSNKPQLIVTYQ